MLVTAIEWITKTKAKVYLNDELAFVLTASELREADLSEDMEMSDSLYEHICEDMLLRRAKLKVMSLLKARDYTEYELRSKLKKEYFPAALIDSAVDYVASYHYIDDVRYAQNYIYYHSSGQSMQMIRYKLQQKGISSEIIDQCLEEAEVDERLQIQRLIESKFGHNYQFDDKKRQKIIGFLLRKGYSYSDVRAVIKEIDTNE